MLKKIVTYLTPPSPLQTKWHFLWALLVSPLIWLGWAWKTFWKIALALANGKVVGAQAPPQPFAQPLAPGIFCGKEPYDVYKDTRERLWDHVKQRGERQWTIMTWSAGLLTAIIGGLVYFAADSRDLLPAVRWALAAWVAFIALFALVRILHDQIIADYHVKACQQMDEQFGLHFEDSSHKIDMKLHHFFMLIILLLSLGSIVFLWRYDDFKSPPTAENKCPCCCGNCGELAKVKASLDAKIDAKVDAKTEVKPAPQPGISPATSGISAVPVLKLPLMLREGKFSSPHLSLRDLLADNHLDSLVRGQKQKTTIDVMYGSPVSVVAQGEGVVIASYNLAVYDESLRREGGRVGFVATFKDEVLQSWSPMHQSGGEAAAVDGK